MLQINVKKFSEIEKLRNQGYQVEVKHYRKFNGWWDLMTKGQFTREYPNHTVGIHINSHGGFTKVRVICPEGFTSVGKFNTPNGRQFNRKIGLKAALGRALKAHNDQI